MSKLIFLLEEPSMKAFLDELLPRAIPGLEFLCVAHEGKRDLEISIRPHACGQDARAPRGRAPAHPGQC